MELTSPVFENNKMIPQRYTCDGESTNPPLRIGGVPDEAQSLVLIVEDPDAPGGTFDHWLVWNINRDIDTIRENEVPEGAVQGVNSAGKNHYTGPCPPSEVHNYHFKLYALDKKMDIPPDSKKEILEKEMNDHILAESLLVGRYGR